MKIPMTLIRPSRSGWRRLARLPPGHRQTTTARPSAYWPESVKSSRTLRSPGPTTRCVHCRRLAGRTWARKVYAPMWAAARARYEDQLPTVAVEDLAERLPSLIERLVPVALAGGLCTPPRKRRSKRWSGALERCSRTPSQKRAGRFEPTLASPIALQGPAGAIDPFRAVHAMASRQLAPADWKQQCAELGLTGTSLGRGRAHSQTAPQAIASTRLEGPVLSTSAHRRPPAPKHPRQCSAGAARRHSQCQQPPEAT